MSSCHVPLSRSCVLRRRCTAKQKGPSVHTTSYWKCRIAIPTVCPENRGGGKTYRSAYRTHPFTGWSALAELTSNERRVVGDEERHQLRDVLRLAVASQRALELPKEGSVCKRISPPARPPLQMLTEFFNVPLGCPLTLAWYSSTLSTATATINTQTSTHSCST